MLLNEFEKKLKMVYFGNYFSKPLYAATPFLPRIFLKQNTFNYKFLDQLISFLG